MPIKDPYLREQFKKRGIDPDSISEGYSSSPDPLYTEALPSNETTAAGSFRRGVAKGIIPTLAGAGGWLGATYLAPQSFGLSYALPLGASILSALGAGYGQELALNELAPEFQELSAKSIEEHPVAYGLGGLATLPAAGLAPTAKAITHLPRSLQRVTGIGTKATPQPFHKAIAANAILGASIPTAIAGGRALAGEEVSPELLATDILGGILFAKPVGYGKRLYGELPKLVPDTTTQQLSRALRKQPEVAPQGEVTPAISPDLTFANLNQAYEGALQSGYTPGTSTKPIKIANVEDSLRKEILAAERQAKQKAQENKELEKLQAKADKIVEKQIKKTEKQAKAYWDAIDNDLRSVGITDDILNKLDGSSKIKLYKSLQNDILLVKQANKSADELAELRKSNVADITKTLEPTPAEVVKTETLPEPQIETVRPDETGRIQPSGLKTEEQPPDISSGARFQEEELLNIGETPAFEEIMQRLGRLRGAQFRNDSSLVNPATGKLVLGSAGTAAERRAAMEALREHVLSINPLVSRAETWPHELFHWFFDTLSTSRVGRDRHFYERGLEAVAQTSGYKKWRAERLAKGYNDSPEEYLTTLVGRGLIKDAVDNKSPLASWLSEFWSDVKYKFGRATEHDIARLMQGKLLKDPSYFDSHGANLRVPGAKGDLESRKPTEVEQEVVKPNLHEDDLTPPQKSSVKRFKDAVKAARQDYGNSAGVHTANTRSYVLTYTKDQDRWYVTRPRRTDIKYPAQESPYEGVNLPEIEPFVPKGKSVELNNDQILIPALSGEEATFIAQNLPAPIKSGADVDVLAEQQRFSRQELKAVKAVMEKHGISQYQEEDQLLMPLSDDKGPLDKLKKSVGLTKEIEEQIKKDKLGKDTKDAFIPTAKRSNLQEEDIEFGINKKQIMSLMDEKMYSRPIAQVSVKELFQNSFDALKEAIYKKQKTKGTIKVDVSRENRTIKVTDDGVGMTPEILKKYYFTLGGTQKDMAPELRSGGLGVAKMAFMLGSKWVKVRTVRDGLLTTVDTTSNEIREGTIKLRTEKTKEPSGTSIEVKIPEKYVDSYGEEHPIHMYGAKTVLEQPFIAKNIDVYYNGEKLKFDIPPLYTKAKFKWGSADIYVSDQPSSEYNIKHHVLSSGMYQFSPYISKNENERLPFDVIIDVKPKVETSHPQYPFNNQRENFRNTVVKDIEALYKYLARIGMAHDEILARKAFSSIKGLPKVDVVAGLSPEQHEALKNIGRVNKFKVTEPIKDEWITILPEGVINNIGETLVKASETQYGDTRWEATFTADKDIELRKPTDISAFDPKLPQYHNNTSYDFMGHSVKAPEFFAEFSSVVHDSLKWAKETLGYNILADPDIKYFAGTSIDKSYGGVHVAYPFKAVFVNPLAFNRELTNTRGIVGYWTHALLHELTHTYEKTEGSSFTREFAHVWAKAEESGYVDKTKLLFQHVADRYLNLIDELKGHYDSSRTTNITDAYDSTTTGPKLRTRDDPINIRQKEELLTGTDRTGRETQEITDSSIGRILEGTIETAPKDTPSLQEESVTSNVKQVLKSDTTPKSIPFISGIFNKVRPAVDSIHKIGTKEAIVLADRFTAFYEKLRGNRGTWVTTPQLEIRRLAGLTPFKSLTSGKISEYWTGDTPELNRVLQWFDDMNDYKKTNIVLSPNELKIRDYVRKLMKDVRDYQNEHTRIRKGKYYSDYLPQIMSRDIFKILSEGTSLSKQLHDDFYKYHREMEPGITDEAIKEKIDILRSSFAKKDVNIAEQFGPLDKAAGIGIPRSWRSLNLLERLSRYGERVARRFAYANEIEHNAEFKYAYSDSPQALQTRNEVKAIWRDITGVTPMEEKATRAALGLVKAGKLGTQTGIRDFGSNFILGMQYAKNPIDTIKSAISAFTDFSRNLESSFRKGVNRINMNALELSHGVDLIDGITRFRDVLSEVQGRNFLEQVTRAVAFGQGKWLAHKYVDEFLRGSKNRQVKMFLDIHAKGMDIKNLKPADFEEMAARFVENVQGTYDYRGLPVVAVDHSWAPVLALSRWSIEKLNNYNKHVITPLLNGNPMPLVYSTLGNIIGGAALFEVSELLTGRKEKTPRFTEIAAADLPIDEKTLPILYRVVALSQISGYMGIASDVMKSMLDVVYGKTYPQEIQNILYTFIADTVDATTDLASAIKDDEQFSVELTFDYINRLLTDNIQAYRLLFNQISKDKGIEIEKSNKFRDIKVFKTLEGKVTQQPVTNYNPFTNRDIREFRDETDPNAFQEQLSNLITRAVEKADGDPEVLRSELTKLKRHSYQTMPNPETMPRSFQRYLAFLSKSQGPEVAAKRLEDYLTRNTTNRLKASLVPTL